VHIPVERNVVAKDLIAVSKFVRLRSVAAGGSQSIFWSVDRLPFRGLGGGEGRQRSLDIEVTGR
jgi:hypothetical protein